ncbi:hypothetical protein [Lysinibacillus fusiformis]|uniref:hypothetical protein n=1 Tax=Lysinibacillus fusiformis TaxID=28031 RepID=UPI001881F8C0|nr:hypothetical protein [Lysinibacillus fusiformis]MBD8523870.1 hypothetical protein [Lysinibacillus fusiformis]
MDINRFLKEIKTELICESCGCVLNHKTNCAVALKDEIIYRTCQCGHTYKIDGRITVHGYQSKNEKGTTTHILEIRIDGQLIPKYLSGNEVKSKAGVNRINQLEKIESYLNSDAGRLWALENAFSEFDLILQQSESIGGKNEFNQ